MTLKSKILEQEKEIRDGNSLICEYMDWYVPDKRHKGLRRLEIPEEFITIIDFDYDTHGDPLLIYDKELKFHKSPMWLIPVLEKIEADGYDVLINSQEIRFGTYMGLGMVAWHVEVDREEKTFIEALWMAIVEFIKCLKNKQ